MSLADAGLCLEAAQESCQGICIAGLYLEGVFIVASNPETFLDITFTGNIVQEIISVPLQPKADLYQRHKLFVDQGRIEDGRKFLNDAGGFQPLHSLAYRRHGERNSLAEAGNSRPAVCLQEAQQFLVYFVQFVHEINSQGYMQIK